MSCVLQKCLFKDPCHCIPNKGLACRATSTFALPKEGSAGPACQSLLWYDKDTKAHFCSMRLKWVRISLETEMEKTLTRNIFSKIWYCRVLQITRFLGSFGFICINVVASQTGGVCNSADQCKVWVYILQACRTFSIFDYFDIHNHAGRDC